jgi:hypothetical protein
MLHLLLLLLNLLLLHLLLLHLLRLLLHRQLPVNIRLRVIQLPFRRGGYAGGGGERAAAARPCCCACCCRCCCSASRNAPAIGTNGTSDNDTDGGEATCVGEGMRIGALLRESARTECCSLRMVALAWSHSLLASSLIADTSSWGRRVWCV